MVLKQLVNMHIALYKQPCFIISLKVSPGIIPAVGSHSAQSAAEHSHTNTAQKSFELTMAITTGFEADVPL